MVERKFSFSSELGLLTQTQREVFLVELWEKGLDTADCIAYHETTLEAIAQLMINGGLPGHTGLKYEDPKLPQFGDVYFTPRADFFPFNRVSSLGTPEEGEIYPKKSEDLQLVVLKEIAWAHRFCSLLGLDIGKYGLDALFYVEEEALNEVKSLDFQHSEDQFRALGFTCGQLDLAKQLAKTRRGVVLGLERKALEEYLLSAGDSLNKDFRLSGGLKGLPVTVFSGAKPLGDEEIAFFRELKNKHKTH